MSEYLACVTATLKAQAPASGGSFTILPIVPLGTGSLGSNVKCQSNEVYTAIKFTVTAIAVTTPPITSGSGGGTIVGTATKVKASTQPVVRKGDSVVISVTDTVTPFGSANVTILVDDPGQDKAKGL